MKNRFFLIVLILFALGNFYSQKSTVLLKGTIVYESHTKITDTLLFKKSLEKIKPKYLSELKKHVIGMYNMSGKKIDTIELNKDLKLTSDYFESEISKLFFINIKFKIVHKIENDYVKCYRFINDLYMLDYYLYNFKNQLVSFSSNEANFEDDKIALSDFFSDHDIQIEKTNEFKVIDGKKCFKVLYNFEKNFYKENIKHSFQKYKREIWVRDDIKVPFLLFVNNKEFLNNYFPVEIVEKIVDLEGLERVIKLTKIENN